MTVFQNFDCFPKFWGRHGPFAPWLRLSHKLH